MTKPRKSLAKIKDEVEFFQHQIDGVRIMNKMTSFLLADEMGLGKSLQALTVGACDFQREWADKILIIGPTFLKWNWLEEIEGLTNFTAEVYHGTPKQREKQLAEFSSDILIANYEQIVNDFDALNAVGWDIVIIDEAHYIKNKGSKRSKHTRALKRERGFALTGSPMLNRPNELWAILNFVDPKRFSNYWQFVNRYCVFGGYKSKQIVGAKNKAELRAILAEYMIRRLKRDCLDLPDKQVINVYVDLHPEQKKVYDQIDAELRLEIPGNPTPMEIENVMVKMGRLRQVAATPATLGLPDNSYKMDRAVEMISEWTSDPDERTPVVVFTQYRAVQTALAARLDAEGIPHFMLNGDTPKQSRIALVNEWAATQGDAQPAVLIVMLQMGIGLNLTAANKAIFIDKGYVPKLNEQAEDRLHRIGADLTKPVQIFCLVAKGTVEERVERILKSKSKLFNSLIENDSEWKRQLLAEMAQAA